MPALIMDDPNARKAWVIFVWFLFAVAAWIYIGSLIAGDKK
jgi:hypothetical protein